MACTRQSAIAKTWVVIVILLVVALLAATGALYRGVAEYLGVIVRMPVELPVSLNAFPYEVGDWKGKDTPLSEPVQRIARNDDYINREYQNHSTNEHINLYVAYTTRPRTMLGHRPTLCYPASGWIHDSTVKTSVVSLSERTIPCLLHRFHRPAPNSGEMIVLNFYVVNGVLTTDESTFSGIGWRTPNIKGNPARYVAQIQIGSTSENGARAAAGHMADLLIPFFPAENGQRNAQAKTR
ncbi:MAG: EpsI family protein [Sedimentisphaerales bacterium]|nr:EpsI family protein [Sedimentisphaerales bacterium]